MDTLTTKETAILRSLLGSEAFGLEIIERVRVASDGKITLHQGNVYPTLRDLERRGYLTSYDGAEIIPERGGRPRRYYKLTPTGRQAANAMNTGESNALPQLVPVPV